MIIPFRHRSNNISDIPKCKNLEIDIKYDIKRKTIILGHNCDTFTCTLEDFLKKCNAHRLLINVKQSGICIPALQILKRYYKKTIKEFIFFDMAVPDLVADYLRLCPEHTAFRLGEWEDQIYEKAKYIWLDYFNYKRLNLNDYKLLSNKYKIIVVSPELHKNYNKHYTKYQLKDFYGVCTKNPELYD